jgi:hypothetical protein
MGAFLLLAPIVAGCAENDQSTLSPKSSASVRTLLRLHRRRRERLAESL